MKLLQFICIKLKFIWGEGEFDVDFVEEYEIFVGLYEFVVVSKGYYVFFGNSVIIYSCNSGYWIGEYFF